MVDSDIAKAMETVTSRYEVLGKIGQGGSGSVYKALDRHLERHVAIKRLHGPDEIVVPGSPSPSAGTADSLFREARTLGAIQHPNIVTLYDLGVDEDGPFAVMEYLRGRPLEDVIEKAPLPLIEFSILVRDVLNGLAAAHACNILHRDMKPSNVMLLWLPTGDLQFKILDFGLAKFSAKPAVQTMDMAGGVMGSIHFMAPEQFERAPLDARTDLYSTGCVFFHALTARHPFAGKTGPQVMMAHMDHKVGPLAQRRPDVPPALVDWVLKFILRKPEERHASAMDALRAFREVTVA